MGRTGVRDSPVIRREDDSLGAPGVEPLRRRRGGGTAHRCRECSATSPQWLGRCPGCGSWGSLELRAAAAGATGGRSSGSGPVPLASIDPIGSVPRPTGVTELDRVLGGGLVPGSVTLLGGEPGIGKSTLLLQVLGRLAAAGTSALLVSAEESVAQVRARASRLDALDPHLSVLAETMVPEIVAQVEARPPGVLVVDSIQAVCDPDVSGLPGSVVQVREAAAVLVRLAKAHEVSVVLVGHVTKEGSLAGPRTLEHLVDTVLAFDGDRHHALRLLRAAKHRFGPTDDLGVLEMTADGLRDVPDPSALFLADRRPGAPGSVVAAVLEGTRPLLVEIQALATETASAQPRRVAPGLDAARVALIAAVLSSRLELRLGNCDVFASAVGGVRVTEPGADLALALALASARAGVAVDHEAVVVGEVGLGGEVRTATRLERRVVEAARLGFRRAVVPHSCPDVTGIELVRVATVAEAVQATALRSDARGLGATAGG